MRKALIALVVLIVIGFIPFSQQRSVTIKANYFDVCQQLRLPANWGKWEHGSIAPLNQLTEKGVANAEFLIHTPGFVYNITCINANIFQVITTSNYISYKYFYTVVPGVKNNSTAIIIDYKTNVLKWFLSSFWKDTPVDNLKSFMEDARLYYGFVIEEKKTDETYVAVKKETIVAQNKYAAIYKAAHELDSFIVQNHINPTQHISVSYYPKKADSLQILIGIPVSKKGIAGNNVNFMRMPGGKVVVGSYKGKYAERQKIYTAMEKYIQDHYLQKQVAPFETYLNNKTPSGDSDVVNMQLSYPVL